MLEIVDIVEGRVSTSTLVRQICDQFNHPCPQFENVGDKEEPVGNEDNADNNDRHDNAGDLTKTKTK